MSVPAEGVLPDSLLLTVEEAADVLRIGRTKAYALAAEYVSSDGATGVPVIRLGGSLRVPRWALLELALAGRVVRVADAAVADLLDDDPALADDGR